MPRKDKNMKENYIKAFFTGLFALISSMLGILTVPVLLMVACNVLDYATGLMASTYRSQDINSYKSIRGIMKKVCMWLLVVVGAVIDQLLLYASQTYRYGSGNPGISSADCGACEITGRGQSRY